MKILPYLDEDAPLNIKHKHSMWLDSISLLVIDMHLLVRRTCQTIHAIILDDSEPQRNGELCRSPYSVFANHDAVPT